MDKRAIEIELVINKQVICYSGKGRKVTFITSGGIVGQYTIPKDWSITRIAQFMCSVIEANKVLI